MDGTTERIERSRVGSIDQNAVLGRRQSVYAQNEHNWRIEVVRRRT